MRLVLYRYYINKSLRKGHFPKAYVPHRKDGKHNGSV